MHTHARARTHWCSPASPDTAFLLLIYDSSVLVSVLADAKVTSLPLGIFGKLQEAGKDQDMELTSGWMSNGYRGTPSSLPETSNIGSLGGKCHYISWVVHFPPDRRWIDMRLPWCPETGFLKKIFFGPIPRFATLKIESPWARVVGVGRNVRATGYSQEPNYWSFLLGPSYQPQREYLDHFPQCSSGPINRFRAMSPGHLDREKVHIWGEFFRHQKCFSLPLTLDVQECVCVCLFPSLAPFFRFP